MDDRGHINAEGGAYAGLDRYAAARKSSPTSKSRGLLAGIKDYINNVGHCDRCKTVVEPRLSTQWFLAVNKRPQGKSFSMADKPSKPSGQDADGKKLIQFTPEMYEKTYLDWMENIHDWCISRQLWWGHRIPAWHCADCRKITVAPASPIPPPAPTAARSRSRRRPTFSTPGSPRACCRSPSSAGRIWHPTGAHPRIGDLESTTAPISTPSIPPASWSPASTFSSSGSRA